MFILCPDALSLNGSVMINQAINQSILCTTATSLDWMLSASRRLHDVSKPQPRSGSGAAAAWRQRRQRGGSGGSAAET